MGGSYIDSGVSSIMVLNGFVVRSLVFHLLLNYRKKPGVLDLETRSL